jgi:predicted AAA+ superfamily ATPase
MESEYIERFAQRQILRGLEASGAVVVEGPKACGKTFTSHRLAKSEVLLDQNIRLRIAGLDDPQILLNGETPRLIDEWHLVPEVWNAVRGEVDKRSAQSQFILTGSATPKDDETRHSGAGRFVRVQMMPMSLSELGVSSNKISLEKLWETDTILSSDNKNWNEELLAEWICRGGWPLNRNLSVEQAITRNIGYCRSVAAVDLITVDGVKRDPQKIEALMYSLGRNSACYVTNKTLEKDSANYGKSIDSKTLVSYIDALKRIWIYKEQEEWGQGLRSTAQVRKAPKRHLVDPSLAVAMIGASPDELQIDRETFGFLFESLVYRDLTIYSSMFDTNVRAYNDSEENEIDAILTKHGEWAAIEVKLSSNPNKIDEYSKKLLRIVSKFERSPKFVAIITGAGPSYTRNDGVHVICIADLTI